MVFADLGSCIDVRRRYVTQQLIQREKPVNKPDVVSRTRRFDSANEFCSRLFSLFPLHYRMSGTHDQVNCPWVPTHYRWQRIERILDAPAGAQQPERDQDGRPLTYHRLSQQRRVVPSHVMNPVRYDAHLCGVNIVGSLLHADLASAMMA